MPTITINAQGEREFQSLRELLSIIGQKTSWHEGKNDEQEFPHDVTVIDGTKWDY